MIESQTASGPGWHRYGIKATGATDGYGDCYVPDPTKLLADRRAVVHQRHRLRARVAGPDGCERAEQELQAGDTAGALLAGDRRCSGWVGAWGWMPEQVWEDPDNPGIAVWI